MPSRSKESSAIFVTVKDGHDRADVVRTVKENATGRRGNIALGQDPQEFIVTYTSYSPAEIVALENWIRSLTNVEKVESTARKRRLSPPQAEMLWKAGKQGIRTFLGAAFGIPTTGAIVIPAIELGTLALSAFVGGAIAGVIAFLAFLVKE